MSVEIECSYLYKIDKNGKIFKFIQLLKGIQLQKLNMQYPFFSWDLQKTGDTSSNESSHFVAQSVPKPLLHMPLASHAFLSGRPRVMQRNSKTKVPNERISNSKWD